MWIYTKFLKFPGEYHSFTWGIKRALSHRRRSIILAIIIIQIIYNKIDNPDYKTYY